MISPIAAEFEQALQLGNAEQALNLAQNRVNVAALDAGAWHCLGHALDAAGRLPESDIAFLRARELAPGMIRYRFSLAGACFMRGDWPRASRHFGACVDAQPNWRDAWTNLARAELKRGNPDAALVAATRAADLPPDELAALKLQAICAEMANASAAIVLAIRERIARLAPGDPESHFLLAMAHWASRRHAQTHACLRRCLELAPDYLTARWVVAQLPAQEQFQSDADREAYLAQWRSGMAAIEAINFESAVMQTHCEAIMQMHTNFYLAYLGGALRAEQLRYGALMQRVATRVCGDLQIAPRPITRQRRRIGVISGMLQQHSVTKLFMLAFLGLDRARFEVIGFCPRNLRDAWSDRYERELDGFHLGTGTPRQWAQKIAEADLDVLVYLDVSMHALASSLAALRLAPVQAVLWGHPFSTGLKNMDWFISSAAMEPDAYAQHYSEQTLLLPGIGCVFDPPEFVPDAALLDRLSASAPGVRAACLQSAEKLSPRHDALFARLLRQVPELHLSFTPGLLPAGLEQFIARLRGACAAETVDFATRVTVHGRLSQAEFAAVTANQDFVLDSLDWSGGVTALETFWLDKPILTLPGVLMRGRHTYAMLKLMQIDELIAVDEDDYLRRATRLATDISWRAQIAKRIAESKHLLYRDVSVIDAFSAWLSSVQPE